MSTGRKKTVRMTVLKRDDLSSPSARARATVFSMTITKNANLSVVQSAFQTTSSPISSWKRSVPMNCGFGRRELQSVNESTKFRTLGMR